MTLRESFQATSPITIPQAFLNVCGEELGVNLDAETAAIDPSSYALIKSRIFLRLATMPNISEGGVSISFSAEDKKIFMSLAKKYAAEGGEPGLIPGVKYGYKGENL